MFMHSPKYNETTSSSRCRTCFLFISMGIVN